MDTVVTWWDAAVFRAFHVQCYISADAGPLLPGAEVPALVAAVATSWGVVAHTFGINVLRIDIIKAGSMAGF